MLTLLSINNKFFKKDNQFLNVPPPPTVYSIDFTNMATTSKCTRTDAAANFAIHNPLVAG